MDQATLEGVKFNSQEIIAYQFISLQGINGGYLHIFYGQRYILLSDGTIVLLCRGSYPLRYPHTT